MTALFWRGNQRASRRTLEALRPNSTVWPDVARRCVVEVTGQTRGTKKNSESGGWLGFSYPFSENLIIM